MRSIASRITVSDGRHALPTDVRRKQALRLNSLRHTRVPIRLCNTDPSLVFVEPRHYYMPTLLQE